MRKTAMAHLAAVIVMTADFASAFAQGGGDQILDGIGETALVARYLFQDDAQDGSRNALHAGIKGGGATFTADETFGQTLELPGGADGAWVELPGQSLNGAETLSVAGWIKLDEAAPWQRFFDFGRGTERYCFCAPQGGDGESRARITVDGYGQEQGPVAPSIVPGRWTHLAVTVDPARSRMSLYIDGEPAGREPIDGAAFAKLFDANHPEANRLYLGRSQFDSDPRLGGRLYDVRIYRITLTAGQVAAIHHNAISEDKITAPGDAGAAQEANPDDVRARLLVEGLIGVEDVAVETPVGELPHLPYWVRGVHRDGSAGPKVRVIWPSPADASSVAQPGVYTITGAVAGSTLISKATVTVGGNPGGSIPGAPALEAFALERVTLDPDNEGRPTPFMRNRDKFFKGLAATNPDSFLYNFRDAFGQPQPAGAQPLGVWDAQTCRLRGHATGHYLSALAQAYAGSADQPELRAIFKSKMDHMIGALAELARKSGKPVTEGGPCNAAPATVPPAEGRAGYDSDLSVEGIRNDYWNWGEGYISGYPPDQFIMLERGATYGGGNDQIWAPYYTLHKILAGLMDCHETGGDARALAIARGMGLWVCARLKAVPEAKRNQMWGRYIAGEYGGMNEAMARLHRLTGDERFIEGARLFDNAGMFFGGAGREGGLVRNVDTLRGLHANQHIPQIIGALETYKATRDADYYRIAENFWEICNHSYTYSIGGVAGARNPHNAECFTAEPDTLFTNGLSPDGQNETCATYNMLKLSRQLFMFEQDAKYMDYYEQALYNHILASVDRDSPANTYHVPLNPGARKSFSNAHMDGFTCCNGTALESNTKLQDSIYFKGADGNALFVNLYIPSTLHWSEKGAAVTMRTDYPRSGNVMLTVEGGGDFALYLRVPAWTEQGSTVKINGETQKAEARPGSYLKLDPTQWKDGDAIEIDMPMAFHLKGVMDRPNLASVFYGPTLLAAQEPAPRADWRRLKLDSNDIGASFEGDPATLNFTADGVEFKPFYETYGYHSVYLDVTLQ